MINQNHEQHGNQSKANQPSLLAEEQLLTALSELASKFNYGRVKRLPDVDADTIQKLAGVKIAIVDDVSDHLVNAGMDLLVASNNNLILIHHTNQRFSELVNEIVAGQPDVILLDYELCYGIRGVDLISDLQMRLPNVCIIGHSSSFNYNKKLVENGAHGSINKPSEYVASEVASLYEAFLLKRKSEASESAVAEAPQNFDSQTTRDRFLGIENELLIALDLLCQGYLISTASEKELADMGVPPDIAEHILSNPDRETGCNLEYWTSPFQAGYLDKIAKLADTSPEVETLLNCINCDQLDGLTREIVAAAHEQLIALIEA